MSRFLASFFLCSLFLTNTLSVNAESVQIYSTDDFMTQLYDEDGLSDWDVARNFQGEVSRDPLTEGSGGDQGRLIVRSDDAVGFYRIYRASMQFDVSTISHKNIDSVTLYLSGVNSNLSVDAPVVLTSHDRVNDSSMSKFDWTIDRYGTTSYSESKLQPDNVYTKFVLSNEGLDYVLSDEDGVVNFGLLTYYDFYDIEPSAVYTAGATWRSVEASEKRPYLEIVYSDFEDEYPLYTQIESPNPSSEETAEWADDIYAGGGYECGSTIAECGCAITSLVMMARAHGVTSGVTNEDVDPGTLNDWLLHNKGYDEYGNVFWSRAVDFFGVENEDDIKTPFLLVNHKETDQNVFASALESDGGVLGFSVRYGHYFALTGKTENGFTLQDPLWYKTKTTNDERDPVNHVNDYNDVVNKAVVYSVVERAVQKGVIEATLNSPAELLLIDAEGNETGYQEGGIVEEIPNSGYDDADFILGPNNTTPPKHVTKRMLATKAGGEYEMQVIGTGSGPFLLTLSLRTSDGKYSLTKFTGETEEGQIDRYQIDVETGEVAKIVDENDGEEEDEELTCAGFVELVAEVVQHERRMTEHFFIRQSERICDAVEDGKIKTALLRLRVFEVLLHAKKVQSDELEVAIDILQEQLRNGDGGHKERHERERKRRDD